MKNENEMYTSLAKAAICAVNNQRIDQALQILETTIKLAVEPKMIYKPSELPQDQRSLVLTSCLKPHHPEHYCDEPACKSRWRDLVKPAQRL